MLMVMLHACGGGGGGGAADSGGSSGATTPKAVASSSLESKAVADVPVALTQLPKLPDLNTMLGTFPEVAGLSSVAISLAVADFQHNGSYSAFVVASNQATTAKAFFIGYNTTTGAWTNLSDILFNQPLTDRVACVRPQQAAVADLNKDGRPDIYVACAGTGVGPVAQLIYLSRADGTYEKAPDSTWPAFLHASSVALADITGDGCIDVVTTNAGSMVIYQANCTGGYTLTNESGSRAPTNAPSNILNVFLIPNPDTAGVYDLLVAADPTGQAKPVMWFANNGSGYYDNTSFRDYAIQWGGSSNRYDYVVSGSYGYLYITSSLNPANPSSQAFVKLAKIVKPRPTSNTSAVYYTPSNSTSPLNDWPSYVRVRNGNLEPYDAACGTTVDFVDDTTRCGKRYPLSGFPAL